MTASIYALVGFALLLQVQDFNTFQRGMRLFFYYFCVGLAVVVYNFLIGNPFYRLDRNLLHQFPSPDPARLSLSLGEETEARE